MSDATKNEMVLEIQNYLAKVKMYIQPLFNDNINMAPGQSKEYDLKTIITNISDYDPLTARVIVRVLDTDPASITETSYINSELVIKTAIDLGGIITVVNTTPNSQSVSVQIYHPTVKV